MKNHPPVLPQRLSDPICVDVDVLYDALETYKNESSILDREPITIKRLRWFCERWEKNHHTQLPYCFLFDLANIIFSALQLEKRGSLTFRIFENLKYKIRFNQIETSYYAVPHLDSDFFQVLCIHPIYAEKNIELFIRYPDAVKILYSIGLGFSGNKDKLQEIYLAICENANYARDIHLTVSEYFEAQACSLCYLSVEPTINILDKALTTYSAYIRFKNQLYYARRDNGKWNLHNITPVNPEKIILFDKMWDDKWNFDFEFRINSPINFFHTARPRILNNEGLDTITLNIGHTHAKYENTWNKNWAVGAAIALAFSCLRKAGITTNEIYLAVCKIADYAIFDIKSDFEYLNEIGISSEEIFLNVCNNGCSTAIKSILSLLKENGISNEKIHLLIFKNAYNENVVQVFHFLKNNNMSSKAIYLAVCEHVKDYNKMRNIRNVLEFLHKKGVKSETIYLTVCKNATDISTIISAEKYLKNTVIDSEETYLAVCKNPDKHMKVIEAFRIFYKIGCLDSDLVELISNNAEYAKDVAELIVCLKPIGLFSGLDKNNNYKAVFKIGKNTTTVKPIKIFELMIKADLFRCGGYDLLLMHTLPKNKVLKSIMVIAQDSKKLYHFDENGNKTEILEEDILRQYKLHYLFNRDTTAAEIENISNELNYKIFNAIYKCAEAKKCKPNNDYRQNNFKIVCENSKLANDIFPLLEKLNSVGLLLQSLVTATFENGEYAIIINKIFSHLNKFDILNAKNCELVFRNGKYSESTLTALEVLYTAGLDIEGLYQSDIIISICHHPKYAQNMVSIFNCLGRVDINLLNAENIRAICDNSSYSAAISSACYALGNKLTQETLNLIFADAKQAIFIAFWQGGKWDKGNDGLKILYKDYTSVKSLQANCGFFSMSLPPEIIMNIVSLNGGNEHLDPTTRLYLAEKALQKPKTTEQKLLDIIQTMLSSNKNYLVTSVEIKGQPLINISFNSADAAKYFYEICNEKNNIFYWSYDPNSKSHNVVFKSIEQLKYFFSDICGIKFEEFLNNPRSDSDKAYSYQHTFK